MFHYTASSSSTGEPPTPPPQQPKSDLLTTTTQRRTNSRSETSTTTAQESDSGYEASPSSIADNSTSNTRFFPEQQLVGATASEEPEFENCPVFLWVDSVSEVEEDPEEWNMGPECNSDSCASCTCRTDSTSLATAHCDNASSGSSDLSSSNRPSSLPIQIPAAQQQQQERLRNYSSSPNLDSRLAISNIRSNPVEFRPRLPIPGSVYSSHPLSWPSADPFRYQGARIPFWMESLSWSRWVQHADRRRQLDSDMSVSSSDEDGSEDVFSSDTAPVDPEPQYLGGVPPGDRLLVPLPDVVLQSTSGHGRRNRSISINLPPEPELIQNIGRSLRRLSDQFERRREMLYGGCSRRRMTIGEFFYMKRSP